MEQQEIIILSFSILIINSILYWNYFYKNKPLIVFFAVIVLSVIPYANLFLFLFLLYLSENIEKVIKTIPEKNNKKEILCRHTGEIIKIDKNVFYEFLTLKSIIWDNENKIYSLKKNCLLIWDDKKKYYKIIRIK